MHRKQKLHAKHLTAQRGNFRLHHLFSNYDVALWSRSHLENARDTLHCHLLTKALMNVILTGGLWLFYKGPKNKCCGSTRCFQISSTSLTFYEIFWIAQWRHSNLLQYRPKRLDSLVLNQDIGKNLKNLVRLINHLALQGLPRSDRHNAGYSWCRWKQVIAHIYYSTDRQGVVRRHWSLRCWRRFMAMALKG